jgi:hypothetical protein
LAAAINLSVVVSAIRYVRQFFVWFAALAARGAVSGFVFHVAAAIHNRWQI